MIAVSEGASTIAATDDGQGTSGRRIKSRAIRRRRNKAGIYGGACPGRPGDPSRRSVGRPVVAVTDARMVEDVLEFGVDLAELLANAFDEGADIGAIALVAITGDEVLAVDDVVNLAIRHILAGPHGQQGEDLELGQRQIDRLARPARAVDVEAQLETAEVQDIAGLPAIRFR